MPRLIPSPTSIAVPGGKLIDEYVGAVNTQTDAVSIAHMRAPAGVDRAVPDARSSTSTRSCSRASLRIEHDGGHTDVQGGQAILTAAGERGAVLHARGVRVRRDLPAAFTLERVVRED